MQFQEEERRDELLTLLKENNYMLKIIISYLRHDNNIDFINNVIANLVASKIEKKK
jgi:hypothetical protein